MKTIERLGFLIAGVALTLVLTPFFERARANAVRSSCQSNLKRIGLSFMQYIRDYDEKSPQANNWEGVLQPYGKYPPQVWHCPDQMFTYVYNAHLGGIGYSFVDKQEQITLVYEGATEGHADHGQSWFPFTHKGGSNVVYMDGHVKWETQKPRFISPNMAKLHEWQRKQDAKAKAQVEVRKRENELVRRRALKKR